MSYVSAIDNRIHMVLSRDRGVTWADDVDLGTLAGITAAQFPAAVAGDSDRAAVAFAFGGGVDNHESSPSALGDLLSKGTSWLYTQYASGALTGKYRRGEAAPQGARLSAPNSPLASRFLSEGAIAQAEALRQSADQARAFAADAQLAAQAVEPEEDYSIPAQIARDWSGRSRSPTVWRSGSSR